MKTYIVAVSGGVDSVALLDLLANQQKSKIKNQKSVHPDYYLPIPPCKLIVAHFDHGIRPESHEDAEFVADLARKYNLKFESQRVELGPGASEDQARQARYQFLKNLAQKYDGQIITAHHQDDMIETAIINLLRGTNRRGLSSLQSGQILRPLLGLSKNELRAYAKQHNLTWHEDSTNSDTKYLRNYVRINVLSRFTASQRSEFLQLLEKAKKLNTEIAEILGQRTAQSKYELTRHFFIINDDLVTREIIVKIVHDLDSDHQVTSKQIDYILWFIKSAKTHKQFRLKNIIFSIGQKAQVIVQKI